MVFAPVWAIILALKSDYPLTKARDYLSIQAHKPCSVSHLTKAVCEILGKEGRRKKLWITRDVCDERTDLKMKRYEAERAKAYRKANKRIQKAEKKVEFSMRRSKLA